MSIDPATLQEYLRLAALSSADMAAEAGLQKPQDEAGAAQAAERAERIQDFMEALADINDDDSSSGAVDEDEVGMGAPCGTAESTWGGEASEWILERVVKRRKNSQSPTQRDRLADDADDAEPDDDGWEYCCVWKGYGEPTWERRGFLRDLGYGSELQAYDAAHKAHYRRTARPQPGKPPRRSGPIVRIEADVKKSMAGFVKRLEKLRCHSSVTQLLDKVSHGKDHERIADDRLNIRGLSMLVFQAIMEINQASGFVTSIKAVSPSSLYPFLAGVAASNPSRLLMLYHGTRKPAATAISHVGLVVPGQGNTVGVANGSAYGVGIYTAASPAIPLSYAHDGDLFICLGHMQSGQGWTNPYVDWRVFADSTLVTPILHFSVARNWSGRNIVIDSAGVVTHFEVPVVK
jgi:hypothetical protein